MIVVVNYGLGNLFSVAKALEFLGAEVLISDKPEDLQKAERLILPGVGAFSDGISYLRKKGLDQALINVIQEDKKPFLGICLGLQLLAELGFEYGEYRGLGLVKGQVRKLDAERFGLKMPHIGWNEITAIRETPLLQGLKPPLDFYFAHSYQLICDNQEDLAAITSYGETITAAIQHKNIFATQFHPEKSQDNGLKILENFINWNP